MTGPEHYREAESLIEGAMKHRFGSAGEWQRDPERHQIADALVAEAQVHATLALAAATALLGSVAGTGYDDADLDAWREVAGQQPQGGTR